MADIELAPYNAAVRSAANAPTTGLGITMDVPGARPEPGIPAPVPTGSRSLSPAAAADLVDTGARSLPPVGRTSFDYGQFEAGPGSVAGTFDSAISRTTSDQRLTQQVEAQRTRLEGMGLQVRQGTGQYELSFPGSVDPEVKLQVRAQQVERGKLLKMAEEGQDVSSQLAEIDQSITNLISGGVEGEIPPLQVELPFQDVLDPRPELSTFLAELDELDDAQLRQILPNVDKKEKASGKAA